VKRSFVVLALAMTVFGLSLLVALTFGAVDLSWRAVRDGDPVARAIFLDLRLPRVLLAAVVGAALAASGLAFQTLLRNALADPFILGVSGGAACGAAVATAFGLARLPGVIPAVAFVGACGATAAVFALSRRRDRVDPARLLLSGLVLNALFSAVILIAFSLSRSSDLTAALRWMMGSLDGANWQRVALTSALLTVALTVLAWNANDLRLLAFGEDDARSRGVDVERVKFAGFAAASIVTGAAVAVSGIIGFIGLLVPHLVRLAWKRDFRLLLPASAIAGATLLVLADLIARTAAAPAELPVGAFTAILGVPFFLSLLRRQR
jgi:iron complex transport system permease protein